MTKQILILLGCVLVLSSLTGCQGSGARMFSTDGLNVVLKEDGQFPESLVGKWKGDKGGWEFVFEPDGTISSSVISLARVEVTPGQTTFVPMKKGGTGIFDPGEWTVVYSPTSRILLVEVEIDHVIDIEDTVASGSSTDYLIGPVSEDGKTWYAQWLTFMDYANLPTEPWEVPIKYVGFAKVSEQK